MRFPKDAPVRPSKLAALRARIEELGVDLDAVEVQALAGGGPGGQRRNRKATGVQLRYPSLGIVVDCRDSRSHALNRFLALRRLIDAVENLSNPTGGPEARKRQRIRRQKERRKRRQQEGARQRRLDAELAAGERYGPEPPPPQVLVETPRLSIQQLEGRYVPRLVEIWTHREVTRFLGGPRDGDTLEAELRAQAARGPRSEDALWPVVERRSDDLIGHCGLLETVVEGRQETELVYVFARDAWGHGYATEAGGALRDHARSTLARRRLISLIHPRNLAAQQVAIKLGMAHEGDTARPGRPHLQIFASG
jgi:RimJ/RimL family protein N-acetyltransferase